MIKDKSNRAWFRTWLRVFGALTSVALLTGGITAVKPDKDNNPYPADVQNRCPAANKKRTFEDWFQGKKVTAGGLVEAADGADVDQNATLDIYRWAYQMFLHVTSPSKGPGTQPVFASPEYYALSMADAQGNRKFVEQTERTVHEMGIRANKSLTDDYTIVRDALGKPYLIVPSKTTDAGERLVTNAAGNEVVAVSSSVGATGNVVFTNRQGGKIPGGKPVIAPEAVTELAARPKPKAPAVTGAAAQGAPTKDPELAVPVVKVVSNGAVTFVNRKGKVVPNITVGTGETDGSIQLTRPRQVGGKELRSLIYYNIAVNDAYAYLRTMVSHHIKPPDDDGYVGDITPTDKHEIDAVDDYAHKHGKAITNPNALIVELKTAWVDARVVENPERYITLNAKVPKYDTRNPKRWVQNGTETMKLALVGMHLVGSCKGQYTMVWATFEHVYNAPNFTYNYLDRNGGHKVAAANGGGSQDYLFGHPDKDATSFSALATVLDSGSKSIIESIGGRDIGGVPVARLSAFGSPRDEGPNGFDRTPAESNASIISLNRDVYSRMPDTDPRKYYFMVGAMWAGDNMPPCALWTQPFKPWTSQVFYDQNINGTPFLANTTMETYLQAPSYKKGGAHGVPLSGGGGPPGRFWVKPWKEIVQLPSVGCFSCHSGYDVHDMSHVFRTIKPLW